MRRHVGQRARRGFRATALAGLVAALTAVAPGSLVSVASAAGVASAAEPISDCTATTGVIVAVDFANFGGSVERACVADPATGEAALDAGGFSPAPVEDLSGFFVCRLTDPATGGPEPQTSCATTPPESAYWTYWHALPGQATWTYSQAGAASFQPAPGSIEFWAFGSTVGGTAGFASCLPSAAALRNPAAATVTAPPCPTGSPAPAPTPAPAPATAPPTTAAPPLPPPTAPPATAAPVTTVPPTTVPLTAAPPQTAPPAPAPPPTPAIPATAPPTAVPPTATPAPAVAPPTTVARAPTTTVRPTTTVAARAPTTTVRPTTTVAARARKRTASPTARRRVAASTTSSSVPRTAGHSGPVHPGRGRPLRIADVPTSATHRGNQGPPASLFAGIGAVVVLGGAATVVAWRRRRSARA